jgi:hypothetical protein
MPRYYTDECHASDMTCNVLCTHFRTRRCKNDTGVLVLRMGGNEMVRSWFRTKKPRVQAQVNFDVDKVAQEQAFFLRVFPLQSSFHHCSIFICHRPLRCVIALTRQHIITSSVFKLYLLPLRPLSWGLTTQTRHFAGYKVTSFCV